MDLDADQLKQAVERQHDCKAELFYVANVINTICGHPGWDGRVHVFDLEGHPTATRAYAWCFLSWVTSSVGSM